MIEVSHLTKYYGSFKALDDVSFEIEEGHVYGFLGPNGAGKSTTMNIMTGCLSATEGTVKIDGYDIFEEPKEAKKRIGYLPEMPPLYMNENAVEYLRFVAEAKGFKGVERDMQVERVISETGLDHVRHKRLSSLSKGYKQRVGIAEAIIGNPKVIILDEPTIGLDPIQILEIRELIKSLGETHTVIFSSHILSEVQTICDQIIIISKGKLAAMGTPEELEEKMSMPGEISAVVAAGKEDAEALVNGLSFISGASVEEEADGYVSLTMHTEEEDVRDVSRKFFEACAEKHAPIVELSHKKAGLEDIFLELTAAEETGNAEPVLSGEPQEETSEEEEQ